jgi:hypothetical protein
MVDISNSNGGCPNCNGKLIPLLLNEDEKKRVRLGLMKIASTCSIQQLRNIQAYGDWLKIQNEFKYIVDGANVAYSHQNFESGRFSYKQIELVVDKMLARGDGKVLVLLPTIYSGFSQKTIPNSSKHVKGKKNVSHMTADDQRIIKRFEEEGMLYLVPQGADDDWYWIFAACTENRSRPAFVITNDLMRDHRLAFLEPRPFIRWRTTHVMNFCFSKAVTNDNPNPATYIIEPGKYSREIQATQQKELGFLTDRWHIPASDRRAWLCLNIGPFPPSSTSPSNAPNQEDTNSLDSPSKDLNIDPEVVGKTEIAAIFDDIVVGRTGLDDGASNSNSKTDYDTNNDRNRNDNKPIFIPQLKRKLF